MHGNIQNCSRVSLRISLESKQNLSLRFAIGNPVGAHPLHAHIKPTKEMNPVLKRIKVLNLGWPSLSGKNPLPWWRLQLLNLLLQRLELTFWT